MSRIVWLVPLSLGLLLACDAAAPTSPTLADETALALEIDGVPATIDVQPLGWLDSSVVNLAAGKLATVAVVDYEGFFDAVDLTKVTFYGVAPPEDHVARIEANPDCHTRTVPVLALADDGVTVETIGTYEAHVLHFDLSAVPEGVVEMCLTDNVGDLASATFNWCVDVTVTDNGVRKQKPE